MHQKLLGAVAAVAIVTALSGPAAAADLAPVKAPPLAPVPQLVSWTGFYVGGNVGWGRSNFSLIGNDDSVCEIECRIRGTGLALGFHAGYNWQIGAWLVGLEGDVTLTPGWEQTACPGGGGPCSSPAVARNDWLSSVRGRLGWTFDRTLIYATGGVAFAKQKLSACSSETCGNLTHVTTGGVVGGGIEWKYNPNFSLRAEGLYYMFRANNTFVVDGDDVISSGGLKNIAVFRVGASWHPQPW